MFYAITDTLLKVSLNTNKTGHHVLRYTWHSVESRKSPIKLVTMFYVIPDTSLKVSLNTNKTGHHVIRYTWHIVESGVKHQKNWP
jgi:hypothetical protein